GLARLRRRYRVVVAPLAVGAASVRDAVADLRTPHSAAEVATAADERLAPMRILRIGEPIEGYATMSLSRSALRRAAIQVVDAGAAGLGRFPGEAAAAHVPDAQERSRWLARRIAELATDHRAAAV